MAFWVYYGPFSLVLSLIILLVLTFNQKFKSLFYRFVQFDIVINFLIYVNFATYKAVQSDIYPMQIIDFLDEYSQLRRIRDFICNWSYHIQSASLLLKCIFRYTLAKYPKAPETWNRHFAAILITMIMYSVIITIPYCFVSITKHTDNYYSIFMNIETTFYFIITLFLGYSTQKALKYRSAQFANSIGKMNRYLVFDLTIHAIVFMGVLLPAFVFYQLQKFIKDSIMMLLVDLVALTPPYILIICDDNIRGLVRFRKKTVIHVLPSDMNSTMK